jgi:hypothetical protein
MALNHRTAPRALAAVVLAAALLVGSIARAEETTAPGRTSPSKYVVIPFLATAAIVIVVVLVQAARAPARDVRQPDGALQAVDRALAAARGGEPANSTRWQAPPKLGPRRAALAAVREPVARR